VDGYLSDHMRAGFQCLRIGYLWRVLLTNKQIVWNIINWSVLEWKLPRHQLSSDNESCRRMTVLWCELRYYGLSKSYIK